MYTNRITSSSAVALLLLVALVTPPPSAQAQCSASCAVGFYFSNCTAGCLTCPIGFYCTGATALPTPCPAGRFRSTTGGTALASCSTCGTGRYQPNEGQSVCPSCPALTRGTNTPRISCTACLSNQYSTPAVNPTSCLSCAAGTYPNPAGGNCLSCTAGYMCPSSTVDMETLCAPGTYSAAGQGTCTTCPAGSACPSVLQTTPTVCAAGTYALAGKTICTVCPARFFCPSTTLATVTPCPLGYFSTGGQTSCTICPSGSYCDNTTVGGNPLVCPPLHFSLPGASVCTRCPAGYACTNSSSAQVCPAGMQSALGAGVCSACPAGYACPNATVAEICPVGFASAGSQALCTPCPTGTYANSTGRFTCTPCPPESYCPTPMASPIPCPTGYTSGFNQSVCTLCPIGTMWNRQCLACPAGYSCPDATLAPQPCAAGTYSPGNSPTCALCPPGSSCPNATGIPTPCVSGSYSAGGLGTCTLCPVNYACSVNGTLTLCNVAAGYYSPLGDSSCYLCPPGRVCLTASGANTSEICKPGTYRVFGTATCVLCPPGFMCPYPEFGPMRCPKGTYTGVGELSCNMCPSGFACVNRTQPIPCTGGTFSTAGDEFCYDCPAGFACPTTTGSPKPCSSGTYAVVGSTNCSACPRGFECPYPTSPTVRACPAGTYAPGNTQNCLRCPGGHYCPVVDLDLRIPCPVGTYSYEGQANCTACPPSYACPLTNAMIQPPIKCLGGSFSSGGSTACTVCPAGFECPLDNVNYMKPCKNGTFSEPGQVTCSNCTAGYYCPLSAVSPAQPFFGVFGVGRQVPCPPGSYAGVNQDACFRCPQGFYCTSSLGPTGGAVSCPSGMLTTRAGVFVDSGATECSPCPAGTTCSGAGVASSSCSPGTYSSGSLCVTCPPGYECPTTSAPPNPCPAGTYSLNGYTSCRPCAAGYICGATQTTSTPASGICPIGYYCPSGATSATLCPAGTYGRQVGGTGLDQACADCDAGHTCPAGTPGSDAQKACPAGFYCPPGSPFPTPCPSGTYSGSINATSRATCVLCPQKSFCPAGSSDFTSNPCPPGYYCPPGSGSGFENGCPIGTYSPEFNLAAVTQCFSCPSGSYCPSVGQVSPIPCTPGTYQPKAGSSTCVPCEEGWACSASGQSSSHITPCAQGHYCPRGTATPDSNPCPGGSYTYHTNLGAAAQCEACWQGYACPPGTGLSPLQDPTICPLGFFCPGAPKPTNGERTFIGQYAGTVTAQPKQFQCPQGTYNPAFGIWDVEQCLACPAGKWCPGGGANATLDCAPGHYCPVGSFKETQLTCAAGTFGTPAGLTSQADCKVCIAGNYCPTAATAMIKCPAGTYMPFNNSIGRGPALDVNARECLQCPPGYYCPEGATKAFPCPAGSYTDVGAWRCTACEAGRYCPQVATTYAKKEYVFQCPAGLYCPPGMDRMPAMQYDPCPAGSYCPLGTAAPVACFPGTYNPNTGKPSIMDCLECKAGHYCATSGATNVTGECSPGFFCPIGSSSPQQEPCPARYYRTATKGETQEFCSVCPAGYFCPEASVNPVACPRGYYCLDGTDIPDPCPIGTFGNRTNLIARDECSSCTSGYYCDGLGLPHPTGLCDPGYYCIGRAFTSAPPGLPTGGLCPKGGYCPPGSSLPTACAEGTFNNFTGGSTQQDCTTCTPGYYCAGSNLPFPTSPCAAGYYCTGGASTPTQFRTPAGHFSLPGAAAPSQCPIGTFNPVAGQGACTACIVGYYCPTRALVNYVVCPAGNYCPAASVTPKACPAGTYNPSTNRQNVSNCIACAPGHHCQLDGLIAPTGQCDPGYYCKRFCITSTCGRYALNYFAVENTIPNPGIENNIGGVCPWGKFCKKGTSVPDVCPIGSIRDATQGISVDDCSACPSRYYCPNVSMSNNIGINKPILCSAGHYCPGPIASGSNIGCSDATCANHTGEVCGSQHVDCSGVNAFLKNAGPRRCPAGFYCPVGSALPTLCFVTSVGKTTYQDEYQQATCKMCPASYWCDPSIIASVKAPQACPAGRYCPPGTGANQPMCPQGSYSTKLLLQNFSQCSLCPEHRYCPTNGIAAVTTASTPFCHAGYYCTLGSKTPQGVTGTLGGIGGICPPGHYCPNATKSNISFPCPPGTYKATFFGGTVESCVPCTGGFFCAGTGRVATSGICQDGYYCPRSCADAQCMNFGCTNSSLSLPGGACPLGHYCKGTGTVGPILPKACPEGTYQNETAQSACKTCPPGFMCPSGAPQPLPCGVGNYCPNNTKASAIPRCPSGTFNPNLYAQNITECVLCEAGHYCDTPGMNASGPLCNAGYYCASGAFTATGAVGSQGGDGGVCPKGHYCPVGTPMNTSNPCPIGTYLHTTRARNVSACIACPPGMYCGATGLPAVSGPCDAGYYCPRRCEDKFCSNVPCPGSCTNSSGGQCPVGHFCPQRTVGATIEGAYIPTPCPAGTYAPTVAAPTCTPCPATFYCPAGTSVPTTCPTGHYCPIGTANATQFPCPAGTFQPATGTANLSQCVLCTAGSYCASSGLNAVTSLCFGGYYCTSGAMTPDARLGPMGGNASVCPPGHYCLTGTQYSHQYPCAAGTYQPFSRMRNESACLACTPGFYCPNLAQSAAIDKCDPGFYCPRACNDSKCTNKQCNSDCAVGDIKRGGECPAGYICPQEVTRGAAFPTACPEGTYSPATAATVCLTCPAGYYCAPTTVTPKPCPLGRYCPNGTSQTIPNCPAGSYNDMLSGSNISDCTLCAAGKYCARRGNSSYTAPCFPGYYCVSGAVTGRGAAGVLGGEGGLCPAGYYCPQGTQHPQQFPCPAGTYNPRTGKTAPTDCLACTAGFYCGAIALRNVTGRCAPGSYCPLGCMDVNCFNSSVQMSLPANASGGACPSGHYCPLVEMTAPVMTVHGGTLISGSVIPKMCPISYYAPSTGSVNCTLCPQGYRCLDGTTVPDPCPVGSYCPPGTGSAVPKCPPGSYSNALGLNVSSDCQKCDAGRFCSSFGMTAPGGSCAKGYFCLGGALDPYGRTGTLGGVASGFTPDSFGRAVCPTGHYCPTGSILPIRCPAGTFNPLTGGSNVTHSCVHCEGGRHCSVPGLAASNGTCLAGFYCPRGCIDPRCFSRVVQGLTGGQCPSGHYCPAGTAVPIPCPEGTTTTAVGAATCPLCPAGFYCPGGGNATECPVGHYCPSGTTTTIPQCPNGTYSNMTMRTAATACVQCSPAMACTVNGLAAPDYACVAGSYCTVGASTVFGAVGIIGGTAGPCPAGHYCPHATSVPVKCPNGTYAPGVGGRNASACLPCPPGYYCASEGQSNVSGPCDAGFFCGYSNIVANPAAGVCTTGHYCPSMSVAPRQCPAGSYNPISQSTNQSACVACPQGQYCVAGETNPGTGPCAAGWYCSGGSNSSKPKFNGGYCTPGYYCPSGSAFKVPCTPGMACPSMLLGTPPTSCAAGYYCTLQAVTATPTDNITGNFCPSGHYCPTNTSIPEKCPTGTYNPLTHQPSSVSCIPCRAGYYCPDVGTAAPTALCHAGYYCPHGQGVGNNTVYACPAGFYCPLGSPAPRRCPMGTFQDAPGQTTCKACPIGYFCNPKNLCPGTNVSMPQACPAGYFCPNGTRFAEEHPCPAGTFSNETGMRAASHCRSCEPGRYCPGVAMTAPGPLCDAGYICKNGSTISAPTDNVAGYICPKGHYCPSGATAPLGCPIGTFSNFTGIGSAASCANCTAGWYCEGTMLTAPTAKCNGGHYCPGGQTTASPTNLVCPYGFFCPNGTASWVSVSSGSYVPQVGASAPSTCPAGSYCDSAVPCTTCPTSPCAGSHTCPRTCPIGHYCLAGTASANQYPCPTGTFGAGTGLPNASSCTKCTTGNYCPFPGMQPSALLTCAAGYICTNGALTARPIDGTTGYRCPSGHYCTAGATSPTPCPQGTFNPSNGTTNKTACIKCPVGRACTATGLSAPDSLCTAGYYCPGGLISATNPQYLCPIGYYCPLGTANPILCPVGTWTATKGKSTCSACPAGYYCNTNQTCPGSNVTQPRLCYAGHYCPEGTGFGDQFPCPIGSFSTRLGVTNASSCALCPSGFACPNAGMFEPLPSCSQGHYCRLGAKVTNPTDGNVTGDVCPRGFYCPTQTGSPIGCPVGTFSNSTGLTNGSQCQPCTAGRYCSSTGSTVPTGPCSAGFFCGFNETSSMPSAGLCPTGKVCPAGSANPLQCPNGTYVQEGLVGQGVCAPCPEGLFCNLEEQLAAGLNVSAGFVVPQACIPGHYCPNGTASQFQYPCPPGTFGNATFSRTVASCHSCPPGTYCGSPGLIRPSGQCLPGYFCLLGSNTSTPTPPLPAAVGGVCPSGSYCPLGSAQGVPCPPGTHYSGVGARNISWCARCRPGYHCPNAGAAVATGAGMCSNGYYCPGGNTLSADPAYICPQGHYCPTGSPRPVPCAGGTYSSTAGATECLGCPEFYFCPRGAITPTLCFSRHVCGFNTSYPQVCKNGTYAQSAAALRTQSQCVLCPAGSYCSNGTITGPCAAGYLCEYGNSVPAPSTATDVINVKKGGLCPLGHFCPVGSTFRHPCTNQTVGYTLGLQASTDCSPCRPGYYCLETSVVPIDCPPGYYCPGYVGRSVGLLPCPRGTYNSKYFATDIAYCVPCKAGYYCPKEAMSSSAVFPVPSGFYSSTGQTEPYPCPGGTYQPKSNGTAATTSACLVCPAGHYCGPQASTWNHTCPEGTYCPPGSTYPFHCPGASYCPRNTYAPIDCPAGYYCPPRTVRPHLCWNGTFCPPKTESPLLCPNGYISRNDTAVRLDIEDSCQMCQPGTFSINTLFCEACTAGYVCLGGTSSATPTSIAQHKGYICPIGYYCPSGSSTTIACPPGTYNNGTGGRTINACFKCPVGMYQPNYAQSTCIRCGKSATSAPGAAECDCIGKYRSFQPGDGSCRCIPGYVFYTEGQKLSEEDSPLSCQPKIYPRCPPGEFRSSTGPCVKSDNKELCKFCPGGQGDVDPQIGVCKCAQIQTYEETCDEACIKESSTITMNAALNTLNFYDPKTGIRKSISLDSSGVLGTRYCASGVSNCDVKVMRMTTSGVFGAFNPSFDSIEAGTTAPQNVSTARRAMQAQASTEKTIASPIVCLNYGDAMVWDVSDPSRRHYPVYVKDSLLNTNPAFDYTAFRDLSEKIRSNNFTLTTFIYTFSVPGVYTFSDNYDESRITVIRVVSQNERCKTSPYEPYTQGSLVSMGVSRDRDLLLAPDWVLIGSLLGALLLLVTGTIVALWLFRRQAWGVVGTALPRYRADGMDSLRHREFANLASKGSTTKRHQLTATGEERVQIPPASSHVLTVRLDMALADFAADEFCHKMAEEAGASFTNVLVLSTTDESSTIVRFVFTGMDDADEAADLVAQRMRDPSSDIHSKLPIVAFEEAGVSESETFGDEHGHNHTGGAMTNFNYAELEDEFWDYERQIDLEGFNTRTLYERLEDQTIHVVTQLAHQRDDLVLLCDKILVESEALKDMFMRIKIDIDDKVQKERRVVDIREEKLLSGQVEFDLPEDLKQVLGQFLQKFFDENMSGIIMNAGVHTNRNITQTQVIHDVRTEYETIVHEEQADGTVKSRTEPGRPAFVRPTTAGITVADAKDVDGFKDMFATERPTADQRKNVRRVHGEPLSPEEMEQRVTRLRAITKDIPQELQDDSDCDDEERAMRAQQRESYLALRTKRYRRAIDRLSMPTGLEIQEGAENIFTEAELADHEQERAKWTDMRRRERQEADKIPKALQDDPSLPQEERRRRQVERERLLAKRVMRMEDVLKFVNVPANLRDVPTATPEEKEETRVKRDKFIAQKLEKVRRARAELLVPMDMDDDSDEDPAERTQRQNKRDEIVADILIKNPNMPMLPDPRKAGVSAPDAEKRWDAIDSVTTRKIRTAQECLAQRGVKEGLSDHSDLDEAERTRRRTAREGGRAGSAKATKKAPKKTIAAAVKLAEFGAAAKGTHPAEYDDDSDLEDTDRATRKELREAFHSGLKADDGVLPPLDTDDKKLSPDERKHRQEINAAFIRGQMSKGAHKAAIESAKKAQTLSHEVEEIAASSEEAKKMLEDGKRAEKDLDMVDFAGTDAERKKQTAAYNAGRLAQRLSEVPVEMQEELHSVPDKEKAALQRRAAAFKRGVSSVGVATPAELEDKPTLSDTDRQKLDRRREAYHLGRAKAAGDILPEEIAAIEKIDRAKAAALRSAVSMAARSAKCGVVDIPTELRDDVPLLSEEEVSKRRHLQAVYLQALKAHQATEALALIEGDESLSAAEKKSIRAAFDSAVKAVKAEAPLPTDLDDDEMLAVIAGRQQGRAAQIIESEVIENRGVVDLKTIAAAVKRGRDAQNKADALPEELTDSVQLSSQDRTRREALRKAFAAGRRLRQVNALPAEIIEEEEAQSKATARGDTAKSAGRVAAGAAEPTEEESDEVSQARLEEMNRLKRQHQQDFKQLREKQKQETSHFYEELEELAISEAKTHEGLMLAEFRRETRNMEERHALEKAKTPAEKIAEVEARQAAEHQKLVDSQRNELRAAQDEVVKSNDDKRKKMQVVLEQKATNEVRLVKTIANDEDNEVKKMKDDIMLAMNPSEISSEEDLKRYKDALMDKLKLRERRQKAVANKEKEFLEAQLRQAEKIENEHLTNHMARTKERLVARAKKSVQSAPELEEELEHIDRLMVREQESQLSQMNNRLAAVRLAKEKELADHHAEEKARELEMAQKDVDGLVDAKNRLQEKSKEEDEKLSGAQKKAVEMMMQQRKMRQELADQRREEADKAVTQSTSDAKVKEDALKEIAKREKESGEKLTDAQRKNILEDFRRNAAKMDSALDDEQKRQQDETKRRLDERRKKKEAEANRKHVEEMTAELRRQEEEKRKKAEELAKQLAIKQTETAVKATEDAEAKKIDQELKEREASLKKKHDDEKLRLEQQLEDEIKRLQEKENQKIVADAERRKKELEDQHRSRAAQSLSEDQRDALLKGHEDEAKRLQEQLDSEAAIQRAKLQDQLEARRRKKKMELTEKQRVEKADESARGDATRDEHNRAVHLEEESAKVAEAMKNAKGHSAEEVAEVVMLQRHQHEVRQLVERQGKRRQEENEAYETRLTAEKEDLKGRLDNRVQLEIDGIPADHPDRERRIEEIRSKAKQMIADRTPEIVAKLAGDHQASMDQLELTFAEEQLQLRMRQWNDIAKVTGTQSPDNVLARYQAKLSGVAPDDELAKFRKEREVENQRVQEKLAKEKAEYEAKMNAEMERLKKDQEEELKRREAAMMEELKLERERKEKKLLAARQAAMKSGTQEAPVSKESEDELKKRLYEDYKDEVDRINKTVNAERDRQKAELDNLLRQKREKKKAATLAKTRNEGDSELAQTVRSVTEHASMATPSTTTVVTRTVTQDVAGSSSTSHTSHQTTNNVISNNFVVTQSPQQQQQQMQVVAGAAGGAGSPSFQLVPGSAEYQQWILTVVNQLSNSPIMEKLIKIERMVQGQVQHGLLSYYLDNKDRQIKSNEGKLETMDLSELTTSQFVVYCFSASVRENIARIGITLPQIKVSVAKSLPDAQSNASAFRNSYFYDVSRRTLFVRDTRLSSIGEFMLVTVHALAHIKAASAEDRGISSWNDADPAFLSEFYGLLEVCTEEMFYMRLPATLAHRESKEGREYRPERIMSADSLAAMEDQLKTVGKANREAFLKTYLMM